MESWKPLYDKLIVRRHPAAAKIAGIDVPDVASEDQNIGTVVAVGNGRIGTYGSIIPLKLQFGDEVLFNKFAGIPLEGEEKDLLILREDEILAYR